MRRHRPGRQRAEREHNNRLLLLFAAAATREESTHTRTDRGRRRPPTADPPHQGPPPQRPCSSMMPASLGCLRQALLRRRVPAGDHVVQVKEHHRPGEHGEEASGEDGPCRPEAEDEEWNEAKRMTPIKRSPHRLAGGVERCANIGWAQIENKPRTGGGVALGHHEAEAGGQACGSVAVRPVSAWRRSRRQRARFREPAACALQSAHRWR